MTAYYLRFLPNYSQTTAPLRQLLKKEEPWAWSPQCSESFSMLKKQLTSPPVLAHFSLSSPTFITCDASTAAVGAVLSQLHDGTERPIAFASRALTPTEQRYSVGEREALACVWACERWHMYVYGRHFTIRPSQQCSPRQVRDTSLSDSIAGRNASASTTITSSSRRAGKTWWQISFLAPSQPQTLLYHHTMKNQLSSKRSMHHCSQ